MNLERVHPQFGEVMSVNCFGDSDNLLYIPVLQLAKHTVRMITHDMVMMAVMLSIGILKTVHVLHSFARHQQLFRGIVCQVGRVITEFSVWCQLEIVM